MTHLSATYNTAYTLAIIMLCNGWFGECAIVFLKFAKWVESDLKLAFL